MAPPFNFKTSGLLKNDPLLIALPDKGAVGAKWKVERVKLKVGVIGRFAQTVLRNATQVKELPCFAMLRTAQRQDVCAYSNRFLDAGSSNVATLFSLLPLNFAPPAVLSNTIP